MNTNDTFVAAPWCYCTYTYAFHSISPTLNTLLMQHLSIYYSLVNDMFNLVFSITFVNTIVTAASTSPNTARNESEMNDLLSRVNVYRVAVAL